MPEFPPIAAGGSTYNDFEHEVLLVGGATYTPPAGTKFIFFATSFGALLWNLEWWDNNGGVWREKVVLRDEKHMFYQGASQRLRIINDSAANRFGGLYGETRA